VSSTVTAAIVVSGATHGLGVVRSLGRQGVPVTVVSYDRRDIAPSSRYVGEVIPAPHPDKDEAHFVKVLLETAHRCPGSVLIPASDAALGTVSRHKTILEDAGLIVASDGAEVTETLLNKATTFALARSAGVPSPATFAVSDEDDVRRFCASAEFPAVLKPELSHIYRELVGVKWSRVESAEEALRAYAVARSHSLEVVLQELIPGDEQCGAVYNAYFWDGEYKVMEVNARHNLSSLLATRCGVNFPWLQYRHLVDGVVPEQRDYEQGVYWIDVTRDLQNMRYYLRRPGYSLRQFLEPYRRSCIFAVLDRHDLGPAAARGIDTLRVAGERIKKKVVRPKPGSADYEPVA
jgi:predicted ATP-grasp superfamily ATP-dependent carboligase